ncbi:sigma-70 family RNA polymerase sigma factor [Neorhodopirellula pilleata]|uniref:RNA polymerase sigma factor SigV n=1 Tax=Neorhodopirellula pilleata TaxID=2714738 RepID=A0A5C5ZYY4_9BACT|nr:sigma-70 family RNA polymerase sigma factor [Neorhodopirellula pilleata]TWT92227.1 RNA polymerase sigma factor SigV [Neorhodopirellula pilleata]
MSKKTSELDSYEQFMRRFLECQRGLLRYVMCFVPNVHDARDIVQNTAIALWKKHELFDPSEPFMPWACRFALNETRLFMRTNERWKHFLDDETVAALAGRREEMADELDERRIHLRECLRKLPKDQRLVVEGYYFEDLSVEQLAESSRRSVDAIYKSLQRIRMALMKCVQRRLSFTLGVE